MERSGVNHFSDWLYFFPSRILVTASSNDRIKENPLGRTRAWKAGNDKQGGRGRRKEGLAELSDTM